MTTTPEVIGLHPVPHPTAQVRRAGFPLDHPYLERCWAPVVGPSSVLLLRHCSALWSDAIPAELPTEDLARQIGLGRGTGRHSPLWHTLERVVHLRFAKMDTPGELEVYTEMPPVPAHRLDRLPAWSRTQHEELLGQHLDGLARSTNQPVAMPDTAPAHVRMAQHLERITASAATHAPTPRPMTVPKVCPAQPCLSVERPAPVPRRTSRTHPSLGHTLAGFPPGNLRTTWHAGATP